ncbi:TauD/TfdA family dioxygenase [Sphingorhabdus wooponensis]|uniref:Uncharacterized protein n=1 Tax=Sphingorhabdus wooponensis TaxID=940136 RepID=A0A3R8S5X2_9SPHN|nr:TauD/TfdA family dioxygenase [Sphingorhabdus wooponensis]RRQ52573.1 hypothetical protein D7D48_06990 [Sphingorhabdus wooponensis]
MAPLDVSKSLQILKSSLQIEGLPQIVRPQSREDAPRRSLSAITGFDRQPLHTDQAHIAKPAQFVLLECLEGGDNPCATEILIPDLESLKVNPPPVLTHPGWIANRGPNRRFYCQILAKSNEGTWRLRFDPGCMKNPSIENSIELAAEVLESGATHNSVVLNTGDWLIIDNWRALHGRGKGANFAKNRRLRRSYWGIR